MAAESIQDIKRRIKSVSSTERITNSMKLVSAGKLRKAKAIFEKTNGSIVSDNCTMYHHVHALSKIDAGVNSQKKLSPKSVSFRICDL